MFGTFLSEAGSGVLITEINQDIRTFDRFAQIVARINLPNDINVRNPFSATKQRQTHSPLRTSDDYFRHFKTPQVFSVAFKTSRFFALIFTSGKRYSSSICPIIANAAFTGTGLVSINKSLNSG